MEKMKLEVGDVVQLNPYTVKNKMFSACYMTITEPKDWGAQGYVQSLGSNGNSGGQAYYRAQWIEMEYSGRAVWSVA